MSRRFDAMASAKVFTGTEEQTAKHLQILADHVPNGVLASVKYDGWRLFEYNGEVLCRSMKPPKNRHTQKVLRDVFRAAASYGYAGLDAEGVVGSEYDPNCMQHCTSGFGSYEGEPDFTFNVFDCYQFGMHGFEDRLYRAREAVGRLQGDFPFVKLVEHRLITSFDELMIYLESEVGKGGEGIMGRSRDGKYKYGRSTMKEGWLWALKPYVDDEAEIIGFEEELENQNEQTVNERGYSERSGHQENMVPKGRLGRFICRSKKFSETFSVGAGVGLTHALRQQVWDNRDKYIGKFLKYKYQAVGIKDRPRQPKFMGFRDPIDMAR